MDTCAEADTAAPKTAAAAAHLKKETHFMANLLKPKRFE
jgi:hypothetical protein